MIKLLFIIGITLCIFAALSKLRDALLLLRIKRVFKEYLGNAGELTLSTRFSDELIRDQCDVKELVMAMESEFDIELDEDDFTPDSTVRDLRDIIARLA